MAHRSLDIVYKELNRAIKLVESYTGIKKLAFVIKACRLKPIQYFFVERKQRLVLFNHWFDEYGNTLSITKNKKIKIIYNNLIIDRSKIICTDLYEGLSQDKVVKMSKLAFIFTGIDDETSQESAMVGYLGLDNYLRCFMYLDGEWEKIPPILLGFVNLRFIAKNHDIKFHKEFKYKKYPMPCTSGSIWLTYLPASEEFISIINKHSGVIPDLLKGNINGTTR